MFSWESKQAIGPHESASNKTNNKFFMLSLLVLNGLLSFNFQESPHRFPTPKGPKNQAHQKTSQMRRIGNASLPRLMDRSAEDLRPHPKRQHRDGRETDEAHAGDIPSHAEDQFFLWESKTIKKKDP